MITERLLKDGMDTLPYYQSSTYNGYCTSAKYKLPNCTCYACGRVQEMAQAQFKSEIPQANAKNWWSKSKWEHQDAPVEAGIICFTDSNYGHVGVCERVISTNSDGSWTILMSDSALDSNKAFTNAKYYRLRTLTIKIGGKPSGCTYSYQGCLVNPHAIDKRVQQDNTLELFEVQKERLRVRNKPSTINGKNYGQFAPKGFYLICERCEENGLTWVKMDENQWCAVTKGYSRIVAPTDYKTLYEQAKKENEVLSAKCLNLEQQVGSLSSEYEGLDKKLTAIDNIIHEGA